MKDFLVFVMRHLVDRPEEVVLHDESDASAYRFRVELARADVGRIVGRNGQTIAAIRDLLSAAASRQGRRATVEIEEKG